MPDSDPPSLRDLVRAGSTAQARFIADEATRLDLSDLAQAALPGLARFRGKIVLLAMPRQIDAATALVALDGAARRIVLCPHDLPRAGIDAVAAAAGAEIVVSQWPPGPGDLVGAQAADATHADGAGWGATEWVLFTSGTAGQPKMVVHTLNSLAGHLFGGAGSPAGPIWCTFYDIRRYGGMQILLRAMIGAGSLVLSCPDESPGAFLARAAGAGATHFLGTPSHWRRALMTEAADLIAPAYVRLSGEVADQGILNKLRERYPAARIVHAFASTEAGLAFEVTDGEAGFPASLVGEAGGASIRIEAHSLRVRSPRNAIGYLDGGISAIPDAEGYVDTGDIVVLRDERYYFAGRRDGTVNVGGQKVHPEEVEAVINQHPAVEMSRVTARASPITGALVVADIVFRTGGSGPGAVPARATQAEIRDFCRARLAPHKVPAAIRVVPSLEIAASGKLVRMRA